MQSAWNELIKKPGSEIAVLVDADIASLGGDPRIIGAIRAFQEGKVIITPGGGGKYGSIELPAGGNGNAESDYYVGKTEETPAQRSLFDYVEA